MGTTPEVSYDEFKQAVKSVRHQWLGLICRRRGLPFEPTTPPEEMDLSATMRHIEILERGIKAGLVKTMVERNWGLLLAPDHPVAGLEREDIEDFVELSILTAIASERQGLNGIHALRLKKKGDLRKASLIGYDKRLRLYEFGWAWDTPEVRSFLLEQAGDLKDKEVGQILRTKKVKILHRHTRLHQFLLDWWVFPARPCEGKYVPPLCYFSDPALATLIEIQLGTAAGSYSPPRVSKNWTRLGLRKARTILVTRSETKGKKIRFFVETARFQTAFGSEFFVCPTGS